MPRQRELLSSTSTMGPSHHQLTYIFLNILRGELSSEEKIIVDEIQPFYEEVKYQTGEAIFRQGTHPEAFYIVLQGSVAVPLDRRGARHVRIRSGAGTVDSQSLSSSNLLGMIGDVGQRKSVESFHTVGGIFGYCDLLLERYRTFDAVAAGSSGATVAMFTLSSISKMKEENHNLYVIVQKLLLRASLMDLANCTCHN